MTTAQLIQGSFKSAHGILLQTLADISEVSLKSVPAGANIQPLQAILAHAVTDDDLIINCLLYTSPSPRDRTRSRMPSSA